MKLQSDWPFKNEVETWDLKHAENNNANIICMPVMVVS